MTAHLRRRVDGALELRVNGVFVMDDAEASSERLLAQVVLDLGARDVLVGGLGLGYTLRALLDGGAGRVIVAEVEPDVVRWFADDTIPGGRELAADPRTAIETGDVRDIVAAQSGMSLDAIVLDVDNGPDFLVHDANAQVYEEDFIQQCAVRLRPDGHLCVWSMADSPAVRGRLRQHFERVETHEVPVRLQGRQESYWVLRGSRPR
ncbi:hypothetical protein BHE97_00550 [Aeromicrobium sp. PE09-221]|uniref:hypothetical protein n=1 Tax=Aeromicrobium sp. PE09-221 TaxID=1898043 RepID=UPI000B3E8510|nr:hypothetical protein [Aeromicrobium sp. PE09-221]OUZ12736.1 hypothetical protein BHE97_00550 [Aeromicrobium sp. PE09-221]